MKRPKSITVTKQMYEAIEKTIAKYEAFIESGESLTEFKVVTGFGNSGRCLLCQASCSSPIELRNCHICFYRSFFNYDMEGVYCISANTYSNLSSHTYRFSIYPDKKQQLKYLKNHIKFLKKVLTITQIKDV